MQPIPLNTSHGHHALKYHDGPGGPQNSDTFSDFVSLVCQEANTPNQQNQVSVFGVYCPRYRCSADMSTLFD